LSRSKLPPHGYTATKKVLCEIKCDDACRSFAVVRLHLAKNVYAVVSVRNEWAKGVMTRPLSSPRKAGQVNTEGDRTANLMV
jgi:hypothetical protein